VLLDHADVRMAELCGDYGERNSAYGEPAGIAMPQRVEIGRRVDLCRRTGRRERALLVGFERKEVKHLGTLDHRISLMSPPERLARLRELQAKAALVIEGEAEEVEE
jgi:hypothetical protein